MGGTDRSFAVAELVPGIDSVGKVTGLEKKGTFEWSGDGRQGTGEFVKFQPEKSLKIVTQVGKDKDSHEFKLKPPGASWASARTNVK